MPSIRVTCVLFLLVWALSAGCAHVISSDLRTGADPALSFGRVNADPEAYKGKTAVWGGEVIRTTNQQDGSTLVEVFQRPLGFRGEPKDTAASEGRFLVTVDQYLDPYVYRRGRKITVGGEILGEIKRPLGEMQYRYPLLSGKEIHLWEEYRYSPHYYYDPWWGYPYWWRPHFFFHFHHHRHR